MTGSKNSGDGDFNSPRERGEDSEDEGEILEESACGRWSKRRREVQQRDVPGVDAAYLAMDTEEGMEVVWNEIRFSESRSSNFQEEKIKKVFDTLSQLDHPNIVKLHKYWIDSKDDQRRVVFITEYMSSGSLKKFLKLTKRNVKRLPLQSWKRWCTQILSSLSYLHSCTPPIIHGNVTTDSIFIQHNGLVKIGSVAPDAIPRHVKSIRGELKNMHYIAPEFEYFAPATTAVDIYSFGMCALETAALEIPGNGDSGGRITKEHIDKTINSLVNELQKDFITKCLHPEPTRRPDATQLLFHPLLFEVHSLKLLAAHSMIHNPKSTKSRCLDEMIQRQCQPDKVVAEIKHCGAEPTLITMANITSSAEKLREFIEDVRNGIYPITAFRLPPPLLRPRPVTPEVEESNDTSISEGVEEELRRVLNMMCTVRPMENERILNLTLSLRLEDKMNRQLTCTYSEDEGLDDVYKLGEELTFFGFINMSDKDRVVSTIQSSIDRYQKGETGPDVNGEFYHANQFTGFNGVYFTSDQNIAIFPQMNR